MVRKIKTSEVNIENVSYDAVVETVTKVDEATNEEPVKQELPLDIGHHVKQELVGNVAEKVKQETTQNVLEHLKQELVRNVPEQLDSLEDIKNVPVEKKPKKEAEKGTCEKCGKTMNLKSLKYSHAKKCNVNTETELKEEIPKPNLIRTVSELPTEEIEKPEAVKKPKRVVKPKAVVEVSQSSEVVEVPTVQKKPRPTRPKKVPESVVTSPSEPVVMKKSRAVLKAEKYENLFQNAI